MLITEITRRKEKQRGWLLILIGIALMALGILGVGCRHTGPRIHVLFDGVEG